MAKRRARRWLAAGAVLLAALLTVAAVLWLQPKPSLVAEPPGAALLAAADGLDDIQVDAVFDPVNRTLDVRQTFALVNRTGTAQRLLVLRAYPNAFQSEDTSPIATDELYDACYPDGFSAGFMRLTALKLQGENGAEKDAAFQYGDDAQTVLNVSLPEDWPAGQTLRLRAVYTVTVPQAASRFGEHGGIWALGNALLIPSPFMDGAYLTDAYSSIGDPFVSECRNYTVRLTAPADYSAAGTGTATVESEADGLRVTRFDAPAARDFALCLSTSYRHAEVMRDGVLVRAYALSQTKAQTLLNVAANALACYGDRYGAYPYPTLSLCEADFPFTGMAYPSFLMIGSGQLNAGGENLEQLLAHEVAHQWWGAAVGNDAFRQSWQDEALAQYALLDFWETQHGADARSALQYQLVDTSLRVTVPQGITPGSPLDYFGDWAEYSMVVYNRGAAALCALDTAMNGGLDGFLAKYYAAFAFKLAGRADFEALLQAYTGEDWAPLLSDYLDTYI